MGSKVAKTTLHVGPLVVCAPSHFPSPNIHIIDIEEISKALRLTSLGEEVRYNLPKHPRR